MKSSIFNFQFSIAILLLTGCTAVKQQGNIVSVTQRVIGLKAGQNAHTQTPELTLGFESMTFHVVPTSTNEIHAPNVSGGIDLTQKSLTTDIIEDFSTGDAALDNPPPKKRPTKNEPTTDTTKAKTATEASSTPAKAKAP